MKKEILHTIYSQFEQFSDTLPTVCDRGCPHCCTQNVTITAIEGEEILDHIVKEGREDWMADILSRPPGHTPPRETTNEFAAACLEGKEAEEGEIWNPDPCPFLEGRECTIYPVRPFSCRLFVSTRICERESAALVPEYYVEAATAANQIIEHLGQKEYWGNMFDVLPALLDIGAYRTILEHMDRSRAMEARLRTLTARPLPGFLLSEEAGARVVPLLTRIFDQEVGGRRIEDILNNR